MPTINHNSLVLRTILHCIFYCCAAWLTQYHCSTPQHPTALVPFHLCCCAPISTALPFHPCLLWSLPPPPQGHFRDGQDEEDKLYSEFVGLLGQEDADKIMEAKHRPMRIVQELSTVVNNANMNDVQLSTIDRNLSGFCDTVGVCERIFKTPMPLVYTRHTSRFLAIWLLFLPLTLYKELGDSYLHLATIPVSFLIAVFFLGIEELGIQIEEPFSVLPMEVMCDGIEGSCKEMLANDIAMSAPLAPATTTAFSGLPQAMQKAAEPVAK